MFFIISIELQQSSQIILYIFIFDFQSNLAMMLETEYLNRQATVVESVKRLLDYQVLKYHPVPYPTRVYEFQSFSGRCAKG